MHKVQAMVSQSCFRTQKIPIKKKFFHIAHRQNMEGVNILLEGLGLFPDKLSVVSVVWHEHQH